MDYVASMSPLVCLSVIMDSMQRVLSGNVFPSTSQINHFIMIHETNC